MVAETGDKEVDAFIWLLKVIDSGEPELIERALQAVDCLKATPKELSERYSKAVFKKTGSTMHAAFAGFGWGDVKGRAEMAINKRTKAVEAAGRYGDAIHDETKQECFCIEALKGLETDGYFFLNPDEVDARFMQYPHLLPATISDCMNELKFWSDLGKLQFAAGNDNDITEADERKQFIWRLMGKIRPRSKQEAAEAFKFIINGENGRDGKEQLREVEAIITNLLRA